MFNKLSSYRQNVIGSAYRLFTYVHTDNVKYEAQIDCFIYEACTDYLIYEAHIDCMWFVKHIQNV